MPSEGRLTSSFGWGALAILCLCQRRASWSGVLPDSFFALAETCIEYIHCTCSTGCIPVT